MIISASRIWISCCSVETAYFHFSFCYDASLHHHKQVLNFRLWISNIFVFESRNLLFSKRLPFKFDYIYSTIKTTKLLYYLLWVDNLMNPPPPVLLKRPSDYTSTKIGSYWYSHLVFSGDLCWFVHFAASFPRRWSFCGMKDSGELSDYPYKCNDTDQWNKFKVFLQVWIHVVLNRSLEGCCTHGIYMLIFWKQCFCTLRMKVIGIEQGNLCFEFLSM